eukprot:3615586-Amphidinium_carterae.1
MMLLHTVCYRRKLDNNGGSQSLKGKAVMQYGPRVEQNAGRPSDVLATLSWVLHPCQLTFPTRLAECVTNTC